MQAHQFSEPGGIKPQDKKYLPTETKPHIKPSVKLHHFGIIFDLKVLILCFKREGFQRNLTERSRRIDLKITNVRL